MGGRVRDEMVAAQGVGGSIGGRLLSLRRRAIHGGVKHGETARMIDGILRRCGHGVGTHPHYRNYSHRKVKTPSRTLMRTRHAAWCTGHTWLSVRSFKDKSRDGVLRV